MCVSLLRSQKIWKESYTENNIRLTRVAFIFLGLKGLRKYGEEIHTENNIRLTRVAFIFLGPKGLFVLCL
jgi:hypothetical protein